VSDPVKLAVVTLVTRPRNLSAIAASITAALENAPNANVELDWIQVWDQRSANFSEVDGEYYPAHGYILTPPPDWYGEPYLRNAALTVVESGHVAWLDDDNTMAPTFIARVGELLAETPDAALVFDQTANGAHRLTAAPRNMIVGGVDTAQVVAPRELYDGQSFRNVINGTDGLMYEAIFRQHAERFRFVNEPHVTYNALA